MFRVMTLVCVILVAGCATNGPHKVGDADWHKQRLEEIEAAYERGQIKIEDYLLLKNNADQIRMDFCSLIRTYPIRPNVVTVIPIPVHR